MMMHPLVIYAYINTALSCGIALLSYILDTSFFVSELQKLLEIFATAQKTVSSSLASSASTVISYLIERARHKDPQAPPPLKRATGTFQATPRSSPHSTHAEDLRHKSPLTSNSGSDEGPLSHSRVHSLEQYQRPIRHFPALEQTSEQMTVQNDHIPDAASGPVSAHAYSIGGSSDPPIIDINAMAHLPFTFRSPSPFPTMNTSINQPSGSGPSFPEENMEDQSIPLNLFDPQFLALFGLTSTRSHQAGTPQDNSTHPPPRLESQASYTNSTEATNYESHEIRDRIQSLEGSSGGNSVNAISPPMNSDPTTSFTSPPTQVGINPNSKESFNHESHRNRDQIQSPKGSSGGNSGSMTSPPMNSGPMTPFTSPPNRVGIEDGRLGVGETPKESILSVQCVLTIHPSPSQWNHNLEEKSLDSKDGSVFDSQSYSQSSQASRSIASTRKSILIKCATASNDLKPSDILIDRFQVCKSVCDPLLTFFKAEEHDAMAKIVHSSIVLHLQKLKTEVRLHICNIIEDTGELPSLVASERESSTRLITSLTRSIAFATHSPLNLEGRQDLWLCNQLVVEHLRKEVQEGNMLQKRKLIMQTNSAQFEEGLVRAIRSIWAVFHDNRKSGEVYNRWVTSANLIDVISPTTQWEAFSSREDCLLDPDTPLRNPKR
ncbi:uncharacterized protein MELLADRAFT_64625 [Melampsora larici-populina 98AG31]|uniref:SLM1/RGC1-like BAR-like domain-containing protein n=1 Tax=Melampsora larici-populina (strain 98AG31 / pathotype 3-4-7) TaxID=747676 RepID=F4RS54_MELLP|nr:uncharacterized protein MELLADRAFT_64625 [Melampsora larici-populina 98AG31]EGG04796.1 hypothetical protein MELLADRAFT_64625 [Melampsora larici-populina 98AG31]